MGATHAAYCTPMLMSDTLCRPMHASQQAEAQQQQQQPYVSQPEALSPAQLAPCAITQLDFQAAVKKVQPSVRREGFATTPDVTWGDVGSLAEVCNLTSVLCKSVKAYHVAIP